MVRIRPAAPSLRHPRTGAPLAPVGYTASGRAVWPILGGDGTDPLTRINELSERGVENLTPEELGELRDLIRAEAEAVSPEDTTPETIAHLNLVADIAVQVRAEDGRRAEVAAAAAGEAEAARTRLAEALGEPETPAEPAAEEPPAEAPAVAETPAEPAATPEPVAASARPQPVRLSQVRQTPQAHREPPAANPSNGVAATLTASAGSHAGQRVDGRSEDEQMDILADAFTTAFADARASHGQGGRVLVAATRWSTGDERLKGKGQGGDASSNRAMMDRAARAQGLGRSEMVRDSSGALVASGGLCRPVGVDYNIPLWANLAEPVKAALPSIDAPRGGLQYGLPQHYDATLYGGSVGLWSAANDAAPGQANTGPNSNPTGTGPTVKPCLEIDCGAFAETDVEAITSCVVVSNFRGRFAPENVQTLMTYSQEAFAAQSEIERLKQMRQAAKHVTVAQAFGAVRDLFNFYDRLRAYYRSVYRLSDNTPLRIVQMQYVREIIRTDLRKAAFPYEAGAGAPDTSLAISDAQIDAMFTAVGLTPVWALDDDTGDQTFASAGAGTQSSPATFPVFPQRSGHTGTGVSVLRALVYPEGTFQRLDGGELNLGVVRDSALNAVNKYQVFSEIFEAVAFRGFEATDFVLDGVANGATAGTITPA